MKLDGVYRLEFYKIHIKAGGIKVRDGTVACICGGWGIVREFYKTIDWYKTRRKNNGTFYYMDAWRDKPCLECQTGGA